MSTLQLGKLASWALNMCIVLTMYICLHCIMERVAKQQSSLVRDWFGWGLLSTCCYHHGQMLENWIT